MQTIQRLYANTYYIIQQHMTDSNLIISVPLCSLLKISFEMYSQTITNESGVRLVCCDASIQPHPLVLLLWLYMHTVKLCYNTFVAHVEGPENKKNSKFLQDRSHPASKKVMRQKEGFHRSESYRGGFLIQRWVLFFGFFQWKDFKDIRKVLKRKKFLLDSSHPVSEQTVQQIFDCRVQNYAGEVSKLSFMTFSQIFVIVRLGSIPGRS